jgi:hypothetical protein
LNSTFVTLYTCLIEVFTAVILDAAIAAALKVSVLKVENAITANAEEQA